MSAQETVKPPLAGFINSKTFLKIKMKNGTSGVFFFVDTTIGKNIPVWYHLPKNFVRISPELDVVYETETGLPNNSNLPDDLSTKKDDETLSSAFLDENADSDLEADPEDAPVDDTKEDDDIKRQHQEQEAEDLIELVREFISTTPSTDSVKVQKHMLDTIKEAFAINTKREDAAEEGLIVQQLEQRTALMEEADSQVLFVMHGCMRNGGTYVKTWAPLAERYNVLVLCPQFSSVDFPEYNTGSMFNRNTGKANSRDQWLFSSIERIFDALNKSGYKRAKYHMFGHSAGAQFVHRMMLFCPQARIESGVAANSGWYTLPSFDEDYPYGLFRSGLTRDMLRVALSRRLILLLGQEDNKMQHLRRTRRAMLQGATRFDRGIHCFLKSKAMAESLGIQLQWTIKTVAGTGHWHRAMAVIAVREFGFAPTIIASTEATDAATTSTTTPAAIGCLTTGDDDGEA